MSNKISGYQRSPAFQSCLRVPAHRLMQDRKAPTPAAEAAQAEAIAAEVVEAMTAECAYLLGPGTTVHAIAAARLRIPKTLVGVDVAGGLCA